MKRIILALLCFAIQLGSAQNSISDALYLPEVDSLPWESPVSPRLVIKEGIKKVEAIQKIWRCECKGCSEFRRPRERFTCAYTQNIRIYIYDSLGFPIRITVKEGWESQNVYEFTCINTYDEQGRLTNAQLYVMDSINTASLRSTNTRMYNDENLLEMSEVYHPSYQQVMRKREYKYNSQGEVVLFIKEGRSSYPSHDDEKPEQISLGAAATGTIRTMWWRRINHLFYARKELSRATEIKEDKIYRWYYYYDQKKRFYVLCEAADLKTGLPLYKTNSYLPISEFRNKTQPKYVLKLIRFRRVRMPKEPLHFKFPDQPNRTEYSYVKR